jgi:hypothetical protein
MKSIFSPCASAPFYMSQDRIHLSNVTVLQLLELEEKIRIHFVFNTRNLQKMYSLHDTQTNVANICPFSG